MAKQNNTFCKPATKPAFFLVVSGRGQREEVALRLREARGSTDATGQ